jgi:hypothetical protein
LNFSKGIDILSVQTHDKRRTMNGNKSIDICQQMMFFAIAIV